jgi:hypothetical protein
MYYQPASGDGQADRCSGHLTHSLTHSLLTHRYQPENASLDVALVWSRPVVGREKAGGEIFLPMQVSVKSLKQVQCSAVQCCAVQCCAVQCSAVL